jgi:hypothetical protein
LKLLAQGQKVAHAMGNVGRHQAGETADALHLQDGTPGARDLVIGAKGFLVYARLAGRRGDSRGVSGVDAAHGHGLCRARQIVGRSR